MGYHQRKGASKSTVGCFYRYFWKHCNVCICDCSSIGDFSHAQSLQSCQILCDLMDCNLPASSVHGIFQARILESVAMLPSRGSSQPRDQTWISCIAGGFFTAKSPGKPGSLQIVAILIFS